mgnify:CR=1 FL=1
MCRFQIQNSYCKSQNQELFKKLRGIPTGSIVFVKWYHRKSHRMFRTHGLLIAKRLKGFGSNLVLRTELCNEVINYYFKIYTPTFIDIGIIRLATKRSAGKSKRYNLLDRTITWKYL